MSNQCYWVYILCCNNGSYYTGYTIDLEKRYESHLNGTASKYTRSFKPTHIAQSWKVEGSQSLAMKIERTIKKLSRAEKEKIIMNPALLSVEAICQTFTRPNLNNEHE